MLDPVGFVLASAVFFVVAARILGSRHSIRDVLVAVPLSLGIYLGFTRLLDIVAAGGGAAAVNSSATCSAGSPPC